MKLSEEEKDLLREVITSDGYKVLLKVLSSLTDEQVQAVTRLDLSSVEDRDLLIAKARGEGAAKLLAVFGSFCQKQRSS